jgi:hypothetical protein
MQSVPFALTRPHAAVLQLVVQAKANTQYTISASASSAITDGFSQPLVVRASRVRACLTSMLA